MIEIFGTALNQWDTGRSVKVTEIEADHVHFANKGDSRAVIMDIADSMAKIPDYLLQTGKQLCVYAVKNGVTVEGKTFFVQTRERPEDYVYEDDQRNYIYELITNAQTAIEGANKAADAAVESANAAVNNVNAAIDNLSNVTNAAVKNANTAANNAIVATERANQSAVSADLAAKNANEASDKANHTAKSLMVIGSAKGNSIYLDDAIEQYLVGLRVFGKTTQNGTPTPEAPVELVSVGGGGSVGVAVAGKNMLPYPYANTSKVVNGITFTDNGDGSITIDGTASAATYFYLNNNKLCGDTVINAMNSPNGATDGKYAASYRLFYNGANGVLSINILSGAVLNKETIYPQVEIGTLATAYERYKGKTLTISTPNGLRGIQVSSGGNYTDTNGLQWCCDEIDFTTGVYNRRSLRFLVDGSTKFSLQTINDNGIANFYCTLPYKVRNDEALCSSLAMQYTVISDTSSEGYLISNATSTSTLFIRVNQERAATAEEFAAFLTDNPIEFVFLLITPQATDLSEEELAAYASLHTYRGNTTVSNDAGAWMEMEYAMDAKKYIDSLMTGTILPATVE